MNALRDFFRSLVRPTPPENNSALHPEDFPLKADGAKVATPDGQPIAVAKDPATAEDIAERLNDDEERKEEDKWSA